MNLLKLLISPLKASPYFKTLFLLFLGFYITQFILGGAAIYYLYTEQIKTALDEIVTSAKNDIKFIDGKWDVSEYYADPDIPGRFRLSVFSTDGFVIDRWRPIPGFLDTSDFKHLLTYSTPQTIHTITNQNWRMYSRPILDRSNKIGVITVSYFNNQNLDTETIDDRLKKTAEDIFKEIKINDQKIDVSNISIKDLPFDISFLVVDKYNTILVKNNNSSSLDRIPNFIDPSYVQQELQSQNLKQVNDKYTRDIYLVRSEPILDNNGSPVGIVVAATILTLMYEILRKYLIFELVSGIILTVIFGSLGNYLLKKNGSLLKVPKKISEIDLKEILFSKKDCIISINGTKTTFNYATNQYYMSLALLSYPKKKWEMDELLDKFGIEKHDKSSWRVVYDTMSAINKKFSSMLDDKLIILSNKTYQINPKLVTKIIYI